MAISDVLVHQPLPAEVTARLQEDWSGCLGGALPTPDYLAVLAEVGFTHVVEVGRHTLTRQELGEMARCPGPDYTPVVAQGDLAAADGQVYSLKFIARKG